MIETIEQYNAFHVSPKRNDHIIRVVEMAQQLGDLYHLSDEEQYKLHISALLHDSTKDFSDLQLQSILTKENNELLSFPKPVWHSFASALLARDYFKIDDQDIFDAIFYHTIGHSSLTLVGQLLFLADYIEVGRTFPCAIEARSLALSGQLHLALYTTLKNTIAYLNRENKTIAHETEQFYAYIERSI